MREVFDQLVTWLCIGGLGLTGLGLFVLATFPTATERIGKPLAQAVKNRRISALIPFICACAGVAYGTIKNNSGTNGPAPQMMSMRLTAIGEATSPSLQNEDVSNSFRSDEDVASPGELALVENWCHRGAWQSGHILTFDADWTFPYATNHLSRVEVWSTGVVYPDAKDPTPIARLATPLALKAMETRVLCGRTTNNTYRVEWHGAYPNRESNSAADAAIELHRNGDMSVTEDNVTTVIPYAIPFGHDGFGQDDDWVRANFTNADEIISVGYANWVEAQVGVGLTNGLYKFTATFEDYPLEATQLYVGDCSVCVTAPGDYTFVLEKGAEYEFGTWPYNDAVTYCAQDDVGADSPMLMSWWGGWDTQGEWTVDGGWNWIDYPSQRYSGSVCWMPTLQGSPNVSYLGPASFPITFEAILTDYCVRSPVSFHWTSSNEVIEFANPDAQVTAVTCNGTLCQESIALTVQANLGGYSLWSSLYPNCGTNDTPQVSIGIDGPDAIFINDDGDVAACGKDYDAPGSHANDDDVVPVVLRFHSDVATNGTVIVRPTIIDGHLWKNQDRTEEVTLEDRLTVSDSSELEKTYYLECEYKSYRYRSDGVNAVWQDEASCQEVCDYRFTAVDCVAEPITSETISVGDESYIVNPCCAIIGSNTYMRVHVEPEDLPDNKIVWRAIEGNITFPNGNTGRNVTFVAGGENGDTILLEVDIAGCAGRKPQFGLYATTMQEVLLCPYLITGAPGAELSQDQLNLKIMEANRIYRQVGIHFSAGPIVVVENFEWSMFGLARKSIGRAIRNYAHRTDGIEVYFISGNAQPVDYGTTGALGRTNPDGVVIRCSASGIVMAHEIGHVCHLSDVYIDENCDEQYDSLRMSWMPDDWNNGTGSRFYDPDKIPLTLIPNLLMYGVGDSNHVDIPSGSVRGLVKDRAAATGRSLGNAAVGRNAMLPFPPHTN